MSNAINRRLLFAGSAGLILAGCSDMIGPPPAGKLYVLKPNFPAATPGPRATWALSIQAPVTGAGLNSERIAILRPPASLDYYADSAWADPLPQVVQGALVEAFESGGRVASVTRDADGVQADYLLGTDLRDFEARYDQGEGAPLAVVRLGAHLIQTHTRKLAGYSEFSKGVRASANSVEAAVAALSEAFIAVLADLVPWTLNHPAPG